MVRNLQHRVTGHLEIAAGFRFGDLWYKPCLFVIPMSRFCTIPVIDSMNLTILKTLLRWKHLAYETWGAGMGYRAKMLHVCEKPVRLLSFKFQYTSSTSSTKTRRSNDYVSHESHRSIYVFHNEFLSVHPYTPLPFLILCYVIHEFCIRCDNVVVTRNCSSHHGEIAEVTEAVENC